MPPWHLSESGEMYSGDFATREEAVEEGKALYCGAGESFWVGEQEEIDVPDLCSGFAETLLESIGERVYDVAGEASEDWPDLTCAEAEALDAAIRYVLVAAVGKPDFFGIKNAERFWKGEQ